MSRGEVTTDDECNVFALLVTAWLDQGLAGLLHGLLQLANDVSCQVWAFPCDITAV